MNEMCFFLAVFCILLSICFALLERRRVRKIMGRMEAMVDAAAKGCFAESCFDETQLSRLESALAHYLAANELAVKKLVSEKDKVKTLVSDISHQTKTPIANLLLYAELLREEKLPQSAQESVTQIYRQADKLRFLIASLVKLSRLETGIVAVSPSPHSVLELLRTLSEQYGAAAREKGLELIVEGQEAWALFDRKWTLEALGNMVDNAIKYTDRGRITLSTENRELFICIRVDDTGMGIDEGETAAVFGRFYRSRDAVDEKGVGIGLFLAREIIQSQGGYIRLKSEKGKGSTFSVFLPVAPANLSEL